MTAVRLTRAGLGAALDELGSDRALGPLIARYGVPPLWARRPGFATLVQIVLEQQVSLSSGRAAFARLERAAGAVTAERIAPLSPAALRAAGLTRQKAEYVSLLARAVADGAFDPSRLARLADDDVRSALVAHKGIGPWTADVYLLMALRRPDAWPSGDLALRIAAKEVLRLRAVPSPDALERIARRWRPWRAVAARVLWQHYLRTRTRTQSTEHLKTERRRA